MAHLVGKSLGRYHILEQLGEGGMAIVYKAYDTRLETDVAVKVIRTERLAPEIHEQALKRFEREAKALAKLTHANIVKVLDYGKYEGTPYLVMPYLPGGTLKQLLKGEPIPGWEAAGLLIPIARALSYAHEENMIHRDVKPANILITHSGDPMLTDFGIAKIIAEDATQELTGTGVTIGTPEYMAPEQVTGSAIDHRADIYALGIVFYEMVTGRKPFQADTPLAVLFKHVNDPLPPPTHYVRDLPDTVEKIILKALAKEPQDRYQDMGEFARALEDFTRGATQTGEPLPSHAPKATAPEPDLTEGRRDRQGIKRSTLIAGLVAIFGICLIAGIVGIFVFGGELLGNVPSLPPPSVTPTSEKKATPAVDSPAITAAAEPTKPLRVSSSPFECTDAIGCVDIAPDEPVHIAYMLTISGGTAFLGEDSQGAIEIAIDDRGGELLGHPILLTGEDSLCSAEGGQTAATKVAADPAILGVIGTNCSSAATAAMPTISQAGLVMLSPSNTAPALTIEGETWQAGYFRICHTDLFQGSVAAGFAFNELGATTAATIHDGSPYADQLQQVFAGRFQDLGGTVTFQGAVNVGDTDMRAVLTSVAAKTPDVLYFPIFEPEGPFIVAQSSEISGLEGTALMGADGLLSDSFPENSGPNVVGMTLSGPYVFGDAYQEFLGKWDAKFGGVPPSGFHAFAYDGTNILLDAIEAVAVVDDDGTLHVGRQALRDVITGVTDYTGLTGKLDCSDDDYSAFGISNASHGDCATGEALGIFEITQAEVDGNWPPPVVYTP